MQIIKKGLNAWEKKDIKLVYIIPYKNEDLERKIKEKLRENNLNEDMVSFVYLDKIDYSGDDEDERKDEFNEEEIKQYYDWVRKSILNPIFNKPAPQQP